MDEESNFERLYDDERHSGRRWFDSYTLKPEWISYGLLVLLYVLILTLFIIVFSGGNVPNKDSVTLKEMNGFRERVHNLSSNMDDVHTSLKKKTCEAGWKQLDDSCYFLSVSKATWSKIRSTCIQKGADLAVITSDREQIFLESISSASSSKWYWIGLNDMDEEGTWTWVDGTNFEASYKHWKNGEPDNYKDSEHCGHLWTLGKWNDAPCNENAYGICEKKL